MINIDKLIMDAMKSKNKTASETYKLIKAKILEFKTQKNAPEYTEAAEIKLLQKMVKEREDTSAIYIQNGRNDLADAEMSQASIIKDLLPPEISEDVVKSYISKEYPDGISQKEMGVVINEIKNKFIGLDGKVAAKLVKEIIR